MQSREDQHNVQQGMDNKDDADCWWKEDRATYWQLFDILDIDGDSGPWTTYKKWRGESARDASAFCKLDNIMRDKHVLQWDWRGKYLHRMYTTQ